MLFLSECQLGKGLALLLNSNCHLGHEVMKKVGSMGTPEIHSVNTVSPWPSSLHHWALELCSNTASGWLAGEQ